MRAADKARLGVADEGPWRFHPTIQTSEGRVFSFEDPRPEDLSIVDIAHALALTNRFGGHTKVPYSVAEHCVRGSRLVAPWAAFHFLMHDASEAYVGDVPAPLKQMIPHFSTIEKNVMNAVRERWAFYFDRELEWSRLKGAPEAVVKSMDMVMLATEARDLMGDGWEQWNVPEPLHDYRIEEAWTWERAEREFLARYVELVEREEP